MNFEVRFGTALVINILLILLAVFMSFISFLEFFFKGGLLQYFFLLWSGLAFIRYISYRRYIYLWFNKLPVLTVNEQFIFDAVKEIQYKWSDIDELYVDNGYLNIKLYHPEKYLPNIDTRFRRWLAGSAIKSGRTPYVINIDMIKTDYVTFQNILDDYSGGE